MSLVFHFLWWVASVNCLIKNIWYDIWYMIWYDLVKRVVGRFRDQIINSYDTIYISIWSNAFKNASFMVWLMDTWMLCRFPWREWSHRIHWISRIYWRAWFHGIHWSSGRFRWHWRDWKSRPAGSTRATRWATGCVIKTTVLRRLNTIYKLYYLLKLRMPVDTCFDFYKLFF